MMKAFSLKSKSATARSALPVASGFKGGNDEDEAESEKKKKGETGVSMRSYFESVASLHNPQLEGVDPSLFAYDEFVSSKMETARSTMKVKKRREPIRLGFVDPSLRAPQGTGIQRSSDDELERDEEEGGEAESGEAGEMMMKDAEKPAPRYISTLLTAAKRRQLEYELVEEKKLQKEYEADKEQYEDKEVFVTSAYRRKLDEREAVRQQLDAQAIEDAKNDVTKKKNLTDFHMHLLRTGLGTRLTAGNPPSSAASKATPESKNSGDEAQQKAGVKTVSEAATASVSHKPTTTTTVVKTDDRLREEEELSRQPEQQEKQIGKPSSQLETTPSRDVLSSPLHPPPTQEAAKTEDEEEKRRQKLEDAKRRYAQRKTLQTSNTSQD